MHRERDRKAERLRGREREGGRDLGCREDGEACDEEQ
jgi:hypothetical protein